MTDDKSKYTTYMLHGLPAGLFGEAYAIVTGTEVSQGEYLAEYFIMTQRPSEALHKCAFDILGSSFPSELGTVDTDFALAEAYSQAEIDLFLLLEKRVTELKRPDLAYLPFKLEQRGSPFVPFVGCWMRGRFIDQIKDITDATKCPSLARYLSLIQQISVTRRGG
jgi:hypothetical protein